MLIKETKEMTLRERLAASNSNNQYLAALSYVSVGTIFPYAGTTAPDTFKICDGSALDVTEYTELFDVIGYTFGGSGDSFNLPDLSGKTLVGTKSSDTDFDSVGKTGGKKTVKLTVAEMPKHSHSLALETKKLSAGTDYSRVAASGSDSEVIGSTGGGKEHENMPPYLVCNYIIKVVNALSKELEIEVGTTSKIHIGTEPPTDEEAEVWINPTGELPIFPSGSGGGNGSDGFSPIVNVTETANGHTVSITDINGTKSFDVLNGQNGEQGLQGEKGDKGDKGETGATGAQGLQGVKGDTGEKGVDGYTPVKGVDYWTEADKTEVVEEVKSELGVVGNKLGDFIQNTDIYFAFDATTNANYQIIRIYKNRIDGSKQYPFVYAPNGANSGTMTTYNLATTEGWVLAINAGVFDTSNRKPDGIVIQNGEVVKNSQTFTHSQCQHLTIDSDGNLGYAEYNADANELVANGIVSAVTGFIPIIIDYKEVPASNWNNVSHYTQNAQRQIIGQFGNGDYAIITCEGRNFDNSDGWTIEEAQSICKKHGLKFAYNLDGGGSTETMLGKKHINTIYEGTTGRIVPTFIVFNGTTTFDGKKPDAPESKLPSGYTELNYVTPSNGGVYIDTGIPATADYDAEYKLLQDGQHILSAKEFYYPFFKLVGEKRVLLTNRYGTDKQISYNFSFEDYYTIKVTGETILVNGTVVSTENTKGNATPTGNLYLFAYGGSPASTNYQFKGRLCYLKLFDKSTGNTVYDFVPCKNPSGVVGLYDIVNNKFYHSNSSTELTGA